VSSRESNRNAAATFEGARRKSKRMLLAARSLSGFKAEPQGARLTQAESE
jgi:hypothetical protein